MITVSLYLFSPLPLSLSLSLPLSLSLSHPLLSDPSLPGGVVDEVLCSQPEEMKNKELHAVPYQLFHSCMTTSYNYLFANIHHLEAERSLRGHAHLSPGMPRPPGGAERHGGGGGAGG